MDTTARPPRVSPGPDGPLVSSSLERFETSVDRSKARWHRPHAKARATILLALTDRLDELQHAGEIMSPEFRTWARRLERIGGCCAHPTIMLDDWGLLYAAPGYCRDRLCPTCQAARSRELARRIEAACQTMNAPRFITLTLAKDGKPIRDRLDRLISSFRKLRQRIFWREHVHGGIATIEATPGSDGCGGHVHIHAIVDGSYIPQRALAHEWSEITGDSRIVWIRAVPDRAQAARYVAGYVSKASDWAAWPPDRVLEVAEAFHGRRMLITFGAHHRACQASDRELIGPDKRHRALIGASHLAHLAECGCVAARNAIVALGAMSHTLDAFFGAPRCTTERPPPPSVDDHDRAKRLIMEAMAWERAQIAAQSA